jgi:signal transduction histidine kinase
MKTIKISILLFFASGIYTVVFAQQDSDTGWTKFTIVNNTAYKICNVELHYNIGTDSSWVVSLADRHYEMIDPGGSRSVEAKGTITAINYYAYDYVYQGKTVRKQVDSYLSINPTKENRIVIDAFYLPPPWWRSWWFFAGIIVMTAVILWGLSKYYGNIKLKKRNRALEKQLAVQTERMRISNEMHDDIGAGLFGIKLQAELLSNSVASPELNHKIQTLYESVRTVSASVREVIWSLNTECDTLSNLISFIHQQAEKTLAHSQTALHFTCTEKLPELEVQGDVRRHIYLVVKEAIHNILKHANATHANLDLRFEHGKLLIVIEDNGTGFSGNHAFCRSMGIHSMKKRVEKLNGSLAISAASPGTKLCIEIPL